MAAARRGRKGSPTRPGRGRCTRPPTIRVTARVREDRPEEVLADACKDSAALILGARERSELTSLLPGSTSRAGLHHATCPTQFIR